MSNRRSAPASGASSPGGAAALAGPLGIPMTTAIWIGLAILYVVWGSTYLGIKIAVESIPPLLMASARFLVSGAILFIVTIRSGDAANDRPGLKEWRDSAVVGGLLLLGGMGLVAVGEQSVPSSIAALLIATLPLWVAVLGRIFFKDVLTPPIAIGVGIGLAGVAVLVAPTPGGLEFQPLHLAALIVSPISWAVGSLYSRRAHLPKRPLVATGMQMLTGGVLLLVASAITGELGTFHVASVTVNSLLGLLYLITIGSLVGFTTYGWLLRVAPISTVTTYAYVNPVVAMILGFAILGEPITVRTLIGGAVIVAAVVLIVTARGRAARRNAPAAVTRSGAAAAHDEPPLPGPNEKPTP